MLETLLAAKDHRARAYATRIAGRWADFIGAVSDQLFSGVSNVVSDQDGFDLGFELVRKFSRGI